MKLIVLNITPYKEKDAIVTALSDNDLISFTLKGLYSEKSKFKAFNIPLSIIEVEFTEGDYKYPIMKTGNVVVSPLINETNMDYMTALNMIIESTKVLIADEDKHFMFKYLESLILSIKKTKRPLLYALSYLSHVLKVSGYDFEVNGCVCCESKKDIVAFSFIEGGFVCRKCLDEEVKADLTVNQMKLLRNIHIINDPKVLETISYSEYDTKVLLNKYFEYIYDNFGISLKSFKTL